ncbi:hypothetical protein C6A24_02975 [Streptococcus anginosus]|uniref:hypothetical protein n=2 Tax=Streptococcus anginosus group TaxID=671232 RepID=UPI000D0463D2|nr:hypothetical protein [Streptococcus constellatus]PRT74593.1 hypothetical protein C6A24_02975 [Streptococcus anginosus]QQC22632.1 hypothetical protein I6H72_07775 [Streptococcus constellatus]
MEISRMSIKGQCLGVGEWKDFTTQEVFGSTLDLGFRNANGRFAMQSIKIQNIDSRDLESYLDSVVELDLTDCTVSAYSQGTRSVLSIRAKHAEVQDVIDL